MANSLISFLAGDSWRDRYLRSGQSQNLKIALIGAGDITAYSKRIEAGDGDSWDPLWLKHNHSNFCVFDISVEALAFMNTLSIPCRAHDICEMALPETYDLILMIDVIEHLEAPVRALRNMGLSLKENGSLVVTTPNSLYWGWFLRGENQTFPPDHFQAYTQTLLINAGKRAGFEVKTAFFYQSIAASPSLLSRLMLLLHYPARLAGKSNAVLVEFKRRNE